MKNLVLTFDLKHAAAEEYVKAYRVLSELGFSKTAQGIELPSTSLIGTWWANDALVEIRDVVWLALSQEGIEPSHLLVSEFVECAWYGPPQIPRPVQEPSKPQLGSDAAGLTVKKAR